MGQVLHGSATTTEAIRRAIQNSQESLRALAKRYGINQKTVAKWKNARLRSPICRRGPKKPSRRCCRSRRRRSSSLSGEHTLLPLDDCLYALQPTIPHLTRSSLHRCLQRHGISRLPDVEGNKPAKKKFKAYPIGYFHIDIAEVQTAEGKLYLYVAIDRTSKFAFVQLVRKTGRTSASAFLEALIAAVPYKIHTVLTDNGIQFTFPPRYADGPTARYMTHMFDMRCRENGIEHRLTKIKHPWTNGQVERMNRTIKEATVQRYHYDRPRSARSSPRRLHQRLQLRPTAEDPQGPHALRIHLQMLDYPARTIQTQSDPSNAGTKHLDPHGEEPRSGVSNHVAPPAPIHPSRRRFAPPQDEVGHLQNGFVTIPPSTRSAAPLVALEAFEQT